MDSATHKNLFLSEDLPKGLRTAAEKMFVQAQVRRFSPPAARRGF